MPDYKKITFISSITLIIFLILILLVVLVPRIFGLTPYIIEDKEMSPYYAQGNLIYVRPKNTNEILVGDIITYYENSGKKISTRRVIAVENNHEDFYTKADTKTYIEPGVVKKRNIIGSPIFQIPYIGLVLSKTAFAWIQGLFFTIAFCLTGITAWNTFVELKKKRRRTQKLL
ncbi:TPA: signal peptidase I [Enterococcus faecium]|uniref:signal peptidase I n=1 Tax=Enterococcus TaxID=1350 RepID=UPI000775270E|nr:MULTISPECIES: signal peptidase I [Enterococcus]EGP4745622.1 signal peptidase I [Enterococcus faecium]EGP4943774.1 signal peptidase I [Enterococcus faecium]EGP5208606.1 signal peptidase I [Enterococcus faecium]EGP5734980.1 signal peptidase I [Enterococcus faecium]EME5379880.1 signal peptidase I [Enterococcus faecium]